MALAALTVFDLSAYRQKRGELLVLAEQGGIGWSSRLLESLEREPDAVHARLRLARALVAESLTPPGAEREGSEGSRDTALPLARDLARESLLRRPAAWEGSMILGAATYLEWSFQRDGRLFRQPDAWQQPLLHSLETAPGQAEPTFFLASAYLELWPALSAEKRQLAKDLVGRAMTAPPRFERLLEPWLDRAADREEAFGPIPDTAFAWEKVGRHFAGTKDWAGFLAAHDRGREARRREAEAAMAEAERRLAGGDLRGARHLFLTAAIQLKPERASAPLVARALERAPAGGFNPHYSLGMKGHLELALERFVAGEGLYEPEPMARLVLTAGELPPPEAALAALAAGELPQAERLERRIGPAAWDEAWDLYRVAKARELLRRRDLRAAGRSLELVSPGGRQAVYWQVELDLAEAAGADLRAEEARAALRRLSTGGLAARDWQRQGRVWRGSWLAGAGGESLSIALDRSPRDGAAVAVRLDGRYLGTFAVGGREPEGSPLRVKAPVSPGQLHRLELELLAGALVEPGAVELQG